MTTKILADRPYQPLAGQSMQPLSEPQAQAHTLSLVNIVTLNRTSSLITKPEVSMTIKMDLQSLLVLHN